ncbi:hypothetical protein GLUCORHAEAF1_12020 [Komagataeibacter rhaeticus AF1]|nr:hypothetical protein GLUCORHAEAF1_12020 [Komagataeibacter rhaeticus AF1]
MAALPEGERTATVIDGLRVASELPVDGDALSRTAHGLPRDSRYGLEQGHARRQIPPTRQQHRLALGQTDSNQITDMRRGNRVQSVQPDGHARRLVPDQAWRRMNDH